MKNRPNITVIIFLLPIDSFIVQHLSFILSAYLWFLDSDYELLFIFNRHTLPRLRIAAMTQCRIIYESHNTYFERYTGAN